MDEAHTYFVGDGQWLVHNCGGPNGDGKIDNIQPPNIVYRNPSIRTNEHPRALLEGFHAKNPSKTYEVQYHISHGNSANTQYISVSKDFYWSISQQVEGNPLYVIDLNRISGDIIDISTPALAQSKISHRLYQYWASRASEVLIVGYIPPNAIIDTIPYDANLVKIVKDIVEKRAKR